MMKRKNTIRRGGFASIERSEKGNRIGVALPDADPRTPVIEADCWWAEQSKGGISLVFDRTSEPASGVSRLEVRMSYEAFSGLLRTVRQEPFASEFQKYVDRHPKTMEAPPDHPTRGSDCREYRTLRATYAQISHFGSEAELIWYGCSITSISRMFREERIERIPVFVLCRVTGPTRALARLIRDCDALADVAEEAMKEGDE